MKCPTKSCGWERPGWHASSLVLKLLYFVLQNVHVRLISISHETPPPPPQKRVVGEWSWCCGGGTSRLLTYPTIARKNTQREHVLSSRVPPVFASSPLFYQLARYNFNPFYRGGERSEWPVGCKTIASCESRSGRRRRAHWPAISHLLYLL